MGVTYQTITNATSTIPAPITYTITGTVTVDPNNDNNLQYTGTTPLDFFGPPPNTGTVEAVVIDGETGIGSANTGKGYLGYTYLVIPGISKCVKVHGMQLVSSPVNGVGNYQYLIYTDTNCTGISGQTPQIVFAKLVGYSGLNTGAAAATINGMSLGANTPFGQAQLSPAEQRGPFLPPVYVIASSTTIEVIENS